MIPITNFPRVATAVSDTGQDGKKCCREEGGHVGCRRNTDLLVTIKSPGET